MAYSDDTESNIIVPKKWYEKLPRLVWGDYEKVDQPDPWFEVYKLTDTVYAIYEDGQFEEVISYLVLGEEKAVIIDTGNGIGDIKAVVDGITDLPVMVTTSSMRCLYMKRSSARKGQRTVRPVSRWDITSTKTWSGRPCLITWTLRLGGFTLSM